MFLLIIPLESSIDDEGLTYFAKDEFKKDIHIGSLVNIPVRDSIRYGIVSDILSDEAGKLIPEENLRSIVDIVCSTPVLSPYQLRLTHALAKKHFVHAHKVLALFFPKFIFNALEKKAFEPMVEIKPFPIKKKLGNISFFHNTKNKNLSEYILEFIEKNPEGSAIIFPDDLLLSQELKKLGEKKKEATLIKNADTYTKRYKNWLEVTKKKNQILIGTRKLLQYNLAGYPNILYIEDSLSRFTHSYEHIYKNLEILELLAPLGFSTTIFSSIPNIESMYALKFGKYLLSHE